MKFIQKKKYLIKFRPLKIESQNFDIFYVLIMHVINIVWIHRAIVSESNFDYVT